MNKYILLTLIVILLMVVTNRSKNQNLANETKIAQKTAIEVKEEITKTEPKQEEIKIIEVKTLDEALKKSKELKKNIFVFFQTSWCSNCQTMKEYFKKDSVKKALSDYIVVILDADKEKSLNKKYNVRYIPKYLILNEDGKSIKDGFGSLTEDQFIRWLKIETKSKKKDSDK